jgi:HJR/Mrr/RecB family endonuclease
MVVSRQVLAESRYAVPDAAADEVVTGTSAQGSDKIEQIEGVRGRPLAMEARKFEFFMKYLMLHCGFTEVCVTKFSADGGVDVNAKAGARMSPFANTMVQVQARRWLHSVGRKEIAELRGSLQPFARGAVVTTSHFSRAAQRSRRRR